MTMTTDVTTEEAGLALSMDAVSVRFGGLQAVNEVSLSVPRGRITAVIGPNGAGKSTLLGIASGYIRPDSGRVNFNGEDITEMPVWTRVRNGMARTFQDLEVFAQLTAAENVSLAVPGQLARSAMGWLLHPRRARRERVANVATVRRLLDRVGLGDAGDMYARELSYGQQKLLVVARLLATEANLMLLDEPGAGLGRNNIDALGDLLRGIAAEGRTVFFTDHNMHLVFGVADYVYVLHHGALVAEGTPAQVQANDEVLRIYLGGEGAKS